MDVVEELRRRRGKGVGPQLAEILLDQSNGEYYTDDHYRRLKKYEAVNLGRPARFERCVDVHGPNCTLGCRSCHSCRQKTVGRKTECRCGRGTGFWCGSCLSTRMGQNINEVFSMPDWRCPSCLEICNCSGRTCDRHLAGLGCTKILSGEAREQGYMSTAHYLIQTHLEMKHGIAPALNASKFHVASRPGSGGLPHAKRPRLGRLNPRSLKEVVEEEMPQQSLTLAPSLAEQAAFQMTELWLSLPQATAPHPSATDTRRSGLLGGQQAFGPQLVHQPPDGRPSANSLSHGVPAWPQLEVTAPGTLNHAQPYRLVHPVPPVRIEPPNLAKAFGLRTGPSPSRAVAATVSPALDDVPVSQTPAALNGPHTGIDSGQNGQPGTHRGVHTARIPQRHNQSAARAPHQPVSPTGGTDRSQLEAAHVDRTTVALVTHHEQFEGEPSNRHDANNAQQVAPPEPVSSERLAGVEEERLPSIPNSPLSTYVARSEGTFGSLVQVALEYYNPAYQEESEAKEAVKEAIELCLQEMQQHFVAPVSVSGYNKDLAEQLRGETGRPEHDMRDHDCLKDACHVLLIAADASPRNHEQVLRLLLNQDPFVDFGGTDPRGKAIILSCGFELFNLMTSNAESPTGGKATVDFILACLKCLVQEHEELLSVTDKESVGTGPLKIGPAKTLDQQRQLQEDILAVRQADDLLIQLVIGRVQQACSAKLAGAEMFLTKGLLALIATRRVSEDVRFKVCCLLTVFLVSAGPDQGTLVDEMELWERQHVLAQQLEKAQVIPLLQSIIQKSKEKDAAFVWGIANTVPNNEQDSIQLCPQVEAITDKLLARVMGLSIAAGQRVWMDMVRTVIQPYPTPVQFLSQASTQERQQASVLLTVSLQATPNAIREQDGFFLVKLWLWLSFDSGPALWSIFSFISKAFSNLPVLKAPFSGLHETITAADVEQDPRGFCRLSAVEQVLTRLKAAGAQMADLIDGLANHVQRNATLIPKEFLSTWESASCRALLCICHVCSHEPRASEFICRSLILTGKWIRASAAMCSQRSSQLVSNMTHSGFLDTTQPSKFDVGEERRRLHETALGALPSLLLLLANLYQGSGGFRGTLFKAGPVAVRDALSPALELATAACRLTQGAALPGLGAGHDMDKLFAEIVANALTGCGNPQFLHYMLGTFLPYSLQGSEMTAINSTRLLTEVFRQPNVRLSDDQLRLLLPQLLAPLLEAMHPTSQKTASQRVQTAVIDFFTSLVQCNQQLVVPGIVPLPMPARNTMADLQLFHRGEAPSTERYQAGLQKVMHVLCCHCVNSLDFSLKGRLAPSSESENTAAVSGSKIQALRHEDMMEAKSHLSMLLGSSRSLEGVKLAYAGMHNLKLSPVLPDFYLRHAEQALKLLLTVIRSGSNGESWGFCTCQAVKPFLVPPRGTDDLRKIYQACGDVLLAAGRPEAADLRIQGERVGTNFEEAISSSVFQASSGRQSRLEPARRSPLGDLGEAQSQSRDDPSNPSNPSSHQRGSSNNEPRTDDSQAEALAPNTLLDRVEGRFVALVENGSKHHVLVLRDAQFRRVSSQHMKPLNHHVHVGMLNCFVTAALRQDLIVEKELRKRQNKDEKIVLRNVKFQKRHSESRDTSMLMYNASAKNPTPSSLEVQTIRRTHEEDEGEVASLPATLPAVALTQPLPRILQENNRIAHPSPFSGGHGASKEHSKRSSLHAHSHSTATTKVKLEKEDKPFKGEEVERMLKKLREMQLALDLETNVRALKQALGERLTSEDAVLSRAVAILLAE